MLGGFSDWLMGNQTIQITLADRQAFGKIFTINLYINERHPHEFIQSVPSAIMLET